MYLYFCRSLGDVLQWAAVEGSGRMVQFGFHGRNRVSRKCPHHGLVDTYNHTLVNTAYSGRLL